MAYIALSGWNKHLPHDPRVINPLYEAQPETPEARATRTQMAFDMLDVGLRQMAERQMGLPNGRG